MLAYIIIDRKINKIIAIEHCKISVDAYSTERYKYTHWDIETSGVYPSMEETFKDTRKYIEKRIAAYKLESDHLYIAYKGCIADGDSKIEAEKKTGWKARRKAIKKMYPKNIMGEIF